MTVRSNKIKEFIVKNKLDVLRDVALFIIITLAIHFIWRVWAKQFDYAPIHDFLYTLMDHMAREVYRESVWLISVFIDVETVDATMYMYFTNNSIMYINESCSGLKQMIQFTLLMLLFPGPWKKKLWFIPLGIFIMHLTNVFRVFGLAVVMNNWPQYWAFNHDYIFRPLFYVVIFLMWVYWVEKLKPIKTTEG